MERPIPIARPVSARSGPARAIAQAKRPATGGFTGGSRTPNRPLTPELIRGIENDPLFMVVTLDGLHWIDPFSGLSVPVGPNGRAATARQHLADTGSWRSSEPLPLLHLEAERWRIDLDRMLPGEPRLRLFLRDNRGWMNPFSGQIIPGIDRPEGKITPRTVWQMAQHLASCPHARTGRMMDMAELSARARTASPTTATLSRGRDEPLSDDLAKAQNVQRHMLADLPRPRGYELAVHLSPHAGVGGDFYEVTALRDGRILIALGDVSGHGVQAALVVVTALKTLRFVARSTSDLTELVCRFNDEIKPDLVPGQFITLFAGVLDPANRSFTCLRAGHQPAILVNLAREDVLRRLGRAGMAVGLASGQAFAATLRPVAMQFEPGDVLVQSTDGALEAMDAAGVEFGEARYLASIMSRYETTAQEIVDGIAEDARAFAGGQIGDDLTVLAVTVLPEADQPASSTPPPTAPPVAMPAPGFAQP